MANQQNNQTSNTPEDDEFAVLLAQTKKHLKKHPNMSVADFANGFLFPLFAASRQETAELRGDLDDMLDRMEIPEEPVLAAAEALILNVDGFFKKMLAQLGWTGPDGFTDQFPSALREEFVTLGQEMLETLEQIKDAQEEYAANADAERSAAEAADGEDAPLPAPVLNLVGVPEVITAVAPTNGATPTAENGAANHV